jgi:hypothetical protein
MTVYNPYPTDTQDLNWNDNINDPTIDIYQPNNMINIDYANEDEIITIPIGTGGAGQNDSRTMTQDEVEAMGGFNYNADNRSIQQRFTDFIAPITKPIKDFVDKVSITFKIGVPVIIITGTLIGSYFILEILARSKKNIKTIKS